MTIRTVRLISLLLASTALAAPLAVPAWAKIGVTSTSAGGPIGEPPQQPKQTLTVGVDVFANERVTTGPNDQAHLLFLDGSALTIGPNSEVILDKFVYDPDSGNGTLALTVGKGVLRLVGGKITKSDGAATVKVGSATIGIRGGIVIIDAQKPAEVDSYFMFGEKLTVATPLGVESALRPGSAISLKKGQPPSSAYLVGTDTLNGVLAMLEGHLGGGARVSTVTTGAINTGASGFSKVNNPNEGTGGTKTDNKDETNTITVITDNTLTPPTGTLADGRLIRNQPYTSFNTTTLAAPRDPANNALIGTANVSGTTLTVGAANGASVTLPFDPGGYVAVNSGNSSSTYGPLSGTGYVAGDSSFYAYVLGEVNNNFNTLAIIGGTPTPLANFPTTGFGQHTMVALGGNAPFLPENVSSPAISNAYYSPLYSAYSPTINGPAAALSAQRSVFLQASLGFSGTGASQSSFFSLALGGYYTDEKKNTPYAGGSFQAYLRPNGSSASEVFRGALGTVETANSDGIFGITGQNMAFVPESINSESGTTVRTPQAALDQPLSDPTGSAYYFVTAAVGGTTSATTPNTRNGGTMQGYAAGLADTRNSLNQIGVSVLANEDPTKVTIITSPTTNRVSATFDLHDSHDGPGGTTLRFGSVSGAYDQSSAYIDDKTFGATQSPITPSSYSNGVSTTAIVANIAMVSGGAVQNSLFAAAGVTPCTCEYLSWGYWAADLKYTSGPRAGEQDRVPVGTWVVGTLPGTNEIPTGNISASYTGHMMGNVSNNGASYMAVGDYTQQWNFGTRSGTATINNFDGASYSGVALGTAPVNPRDFFGSGAGTGGRSISINGSFFKGGGDPVAAVGGNFRIDGTSYLAVGSFAAGKVP